ncbi:MAG: DUF433 domain-containing protein [Gemmatimonas sp.]|nr:DUF433 domain-containing protein [Gemmatimonas sp.]
MRRAPGIVFVDGATGRRAALGGTGLDVWEIIATWREGGESYEELVRNYPWLSEAQLRAALGYYELYPEAIDRRLEREERWTPERVKRELPLATPRAAVRRKRRKEPGADRPGVEMLARHTTGQ